MQALRGTFCTPSTPRCPPLLLKKEGASGAVVAAARTANRKGVRSPPSRSEHQDASSPGRKSLGTTRPPNVPPNAPPRNEPSSADAFFSPVTRRDICRQSRRVESKPPGVLRPQTAVIKRSSSLNKDDKDKLVSKENLSKHKAISYKELSARDDGDGAESPPKYPTAFEPPRDAAPVISDKLPRRIPDDAKSVAKRLGSAHSPLSTICSPYEYNAAFGSRPKVMRTPDVENIKKRNTMMVMY
jgi:hypothetical protein